MKKLKAFNARLMKRNFDSVKGITLEFLVASINTNNDSLAMVFPREFMEEISTIYSERIGVDVLCFFDEKDGPGLEKDFINYFYRVDLASKQSLRAGGPKNKKIFIEEAALNNKNIIIKQSSNNFIINKDSSFDLLISSLSSLYYKQEQTGRPGTFIVKGGIIDFFPCGSLDLFRISFLDEQTKIYRVDKETKKISEKISALKIVSARNSGDVFSLLDILLKNKIKPFYLKKNILYRAASVSQKPAFIDVQPVDFQRFITKHKKASFLQIDVPCERGFIYKETLYIPSWFLNPLNKEGPQHKETQEDFIPFIEGGLYVHEEFGYCEFLGLETFDSHEKLCLKFLDGIVKVDVGHIHKLFFFSRSCNRKLSSLSKTGVWKKTIRSGEKKAREFVGDLLLTYKKRDVLLNRGFDTQDILINDFVRAFKYQDTLDQNLCWKDLLKDFKSKRPLNRLICGDVGFGKTEMAIRAAFVASINNDRVLVLAPTTILANQLFECFYSRLNPFGVFVGVVSSVSKNNKQTIHNFINKKIDVIIGTSAILFQEGVLKCCGLFIVDEEHRFGVKDKEKVLRVNPSVNFLSMSATPIPRSLQLSLNKIRNLSLLSSPPKNRKSIISSVSYFNIKIIKSSILREINRGGQVYIVDNSVNSLKKLRQKIVVLFKNISVEIIYSSMGGSKLINIMSDFSSGKTQVLLSTTIIESGIDVGSSNTIIINNAHCFGLSQLYQLRGRVGRSSSQAYAWFLIPQKHTLSINATKRLKAILKHTALGVGYKISQEDLEIRGAGSLFGYDQSGQGGVGFELYSHLLSKVAMEIQKNKAALRCFVNVFSIKIPEEVVSSPGVRAAYYKSIYSATSLGTLIKIKKTILSELGFFSNKFDLLFKNKKLEFLGRPVGIKEIVSKNNCVVVVFYLSVVNKSLDSLLLYIETFFKNKKILFNFIQSNENLIFQYTKTSKDDYILLCSFLKNISFV